MDCPSVYQVITCNYQSIFFCDPPLKSAGKGARFGGFLRFRESGVLGGNPSIPLNLASFGEPNRSFGMPMRYS
jgi:hypothetical protein